MEGQVMLQEARDFEALRAELDARMRELAGDDTDYTDAGFRTGDCGEAQVPGMRSMPKPVPAMGPQPVGPAREEAFPTLEEVERAYIHEVLEARNWRVSGPKGAARILGLNPSTLRSRMKKLGISRYAPRKARG
jgi:transcriptional regulator with GAF, ATPase, and Fis domain